MSSSQIYDQLRQRLLEHGFICNRIEIDVVAPSVYMALMETVIETALIGKPLPKVERFAKQRGFIKLFARFI